MKFRLIHTADWHLGHSLHGFSREEEQRAFLEWLLHQASEQEVDALLIAGDIFDTANPPASAMALYYSFLARLKTACPDVEVIVIAGNHDSPQRLHAPQALLKALKIHVVGTADSPQDMLIRLHDKEGRVTVQCAAVPFLRPADLPAVDDGDPLIEGVRQVYASVLDKREDDLPSIAMGHAYMVGTQLSELSERKILGGNQHALPVDIFPDDLSYVALGHLHLAQKVGGDSVRYSGSPIPLALDEASYTHQVLLVELEGKELVEVQPLRVPRAVEILQIPQEGSLPLDQVETAIAELPDSNAYLKIHVSVDQPEPQLRQMVESYLQHKALRLCLLQVSYPATADSKEGFAEAQLKRLDPEQIFRHRYRSEYADEPSSELLEAFHELVDQAHQELAK